MRRFTALSFAIVVGLSGLAAGLPKTAAAAYGDTTTYVSRIYWGDGKSRLRAFFDFPEDIAVTGNGGFVIADTWNNVVRRIKPNGIVKTVAGTGSYGDSIGGADTAEFALPRGIAQGGGAIYVADTDNGKIKKIKDGVVTTLVSGLNKPEGVAVHGNTVYFLDTGNNALKKVSVNGGTVTQLSGSLNDPKKLDISPDGKFAYIADAGSHRIRRVNLETTAIITVAGTGDEGKKNGPCDNATFDNLWGIHLADENTIFVSDGNGFDDFVRQIEIGEPCLVSTFASDATMTSLNFPRGLTSRGDFLYVLATGIGVVQRYELNNAINTEKWAGANRFNVKNRKPVLVGQPKFLVLSENKRNIFVAENNRIRRLRRGDLTKSTLIAGNVIDNYNKNDNISYFGEEARFSDIPSMALAANGRKLFVVDRNNNRIREVIIATGEVKYLTGAGEINLVGGQNNDFQNGMPCPNIKNTGQAGCAYFNRPTGSAIHPDGKYLYVADSGNNRIRRVVLRGPNKGKVTTLAGSGEAGYADGTGTAAKFNAPIGLAISKTGKVLFVADRDNHRIRKVNTETKNVTTLAGSGDNGNLDATLLEAQFSFPEWIARGKNGVFYVSEVGAHKIRLIDRPNNVTKLVSGSGTRGFHNGNQDTSRFNNPRGLLPLKNKLLVAELLNDQIRSINIEGEAPYTDPAPDVTSVSPNKIAKEWFSTPTAKVEFNGSNFRHGAKAFLGPHAAVNTFVISDTKLVVEMPISAMGAGYYTVRVRNVDGQQDDLIRGLAVEQGGSIPNVDYWP
jgi:sugar lactone lactonase YvrE